MVKFLLQLLLWIKLEDEAKDEAAAKSAMAELNGKDIGGRNVVVSEARPMTDKPKREFDRGSRNGDYRQRR